MAKQKKLKSKIIKVNVVYQDPIDDNDEYLYLDENEMRESFEVQIDKLQEELRNQIKESERPRII
jgi:benzoyl-CoA reductase/2-hydroxyglutaryl-CoA dehydratase subunit BcrC/BadD/HgdB